MADHIIIYSHGFGVKKDGRGLFTDIATHFPKAEHIMFDYNEADEAENTLTVAPLDKQAEMLTDVFEKAMRENPDTTIDIIAHSQGCIVAALAKVPSRKTIFLAPQTQIIPSAEDKLRNYIDRRPDTIVREGVTFMPRRDGSTTIIGQDYWQSYEALPDIPSLYNALSDVSELTIVGALEDEVIGKQDYSNIAPNVKIIEIHANHDFKNAARSKMIDIVKGVLNE